MSDKLSVHRFHEQDAALWDRFVNESINGTFMHSRQFLKYHPEGRFIDHSLLVRRSDGRLFAVFSAAELEDRDQRLLQSHPGATYGGLVVRSGAAAEDLYQAMMEIVAYARHRGFTRVGMRTTEKVFLPVEFEELNAAYFRSGFQIVARELSSAIRLQGLTSENEVLANWTSAGRRALRRAQHCGLTARSSEDFELFWNLLETNLASRHAVTPTHTLQEIDQLRILLPGRVELVGAYQGEQLIAGVVVFFMNETAAHTMYLAQDYQFQNCRSLNLAVYTAVIECLRRGLQWLNLGISTVPGTLGFEFNPGLFAFKRNCGAEGVMRDSWQLSLQ